MVTIDDALRAISGQLKQLGQRQEAIIMAVNANTDSVGILAGQVEKVVEWMNEPPSTDLADGIKAMATALRALETAMASVPQQIADAVAQRLR